MSGAMTRCISFVGVVVCALGVAVPRAASLADVPSTPQPDYARAHVPGEREYHSRLILKPKDLASRSNDLGGVLAGRVLTHFEDTSEFVVSAGGIDALNREIDELMRTGLFEYVEPDWLLFPAGDTDAVIPNDPRFSLAWQHTRIGAPEAWAHTVGRPDVVVALVDTGVDIDHPDLIDNMVPGYHTPSNAPQADGAPVDDINGHGTLCAGLISAAGDNGIGVVGVGWRLSVMPVRVTDRPDGAAFSSEINQGARWAAENGADVVNISYSGGTSSSASATARYCDELGTLYVRAIGNSSFNFTTPDVEETILVGATTTSDHLWVSSSYGVSMDLVAPGQAVQTTSRNGGYSGADGTSFSGPIVAGVIGLVRSINPALTTQEVRDILFDSAEDLGEPGKDIVFGHGIVSAREAVRAATRTILPPCSADFDSDGTVWLDDFGIFIAFLGDPHCELVPCRADLDRDLSVDLDDFSIFTAQYGRTDCP